MVQRSGTAPWLLWLLANTTLLALLPAVQSQHNYAEHLSLVYQLRAAHETPLAKTLQTAGLADMPALAAAANADQRQGSGNSGSSSGSAPPQGAGAAKAPAPAPGSSGSSSSSNTAGSPPQPQPQPQPQRPRAPMPPGESSVPQQVRALGNPSCVWLPEAQQCTPTQDNWLIPAEGLPSSPFRRANLQAIARQRHCTQTHTQAGPCWQDAARRCYWYTGPGVLKGECRSADVLEVFFFASNGFLATMFDIPSAMTCPGTLAADFLRCFGHPAAHDECGKIGGCFAATSGRDSRATAAQRSMASGMLVRAASHSAPNGGQTAPLSRDPSSLRQRCNTSGAGAPDAAGAGAAAAPSGGAAGAPATAAAANSSSSSTVGHLPLPRPPGNANVTICLPQRMSGMSSDAFSAFLKQLWELDDVVMGKCAAACWLREARQCRMLQALKRSECEVAPFCAWDRTTASCAHRANEWTSDYDFLVKRLYGLCLDIDNESDCRVTEQTKPRSTFDWKNYVPLSVAVPCTA